VSVFTGDDVGRTAHVRDALDATDATPHVQWAVVVRG